MSDVLFFHNSEEYRVVVEEDRVYNHYTFLSRELAEKFYAEKYLEMKGRPYDPLDFSILLK